MIIYNYHPETNEFMSASEADQSPLEPGIFLIPAHATTQEPPTATAGQAIVFENGQWVSKPDNRGKTFYKKDTKERVIFSNIGDVPDDTVTDVVPGEFAVWDSTQNAWGFDLASYKTQQIAHLAGIYATQLNASFTTTAVDGNPASFSYDDAAQKRFGKQTALLAFDSSITSVDWFSNDRGHVTLTVDQFRGIVRDGAKHESDAAFKFLYAKAHIENATTQADVDAVVNTY